MIYLPLEANRYMTFGGVRKRVVERYITVGSYHSTIKTNANDLDMVVTHWHVNASSGAKYPATNLAEALSVNHVHAR